MTLPWEPGGAPAPDMGFGGGPIGPTVLPPASPPGLPGGYGSPDALPAPEQVDYTVFPDLSTDLDTVKGKYVPAMFQWEQEKTQAWNQYKAANPDVKVTNGTVVRTVEVTERVQKFDDDYPDQPVLDANNQPVYEEKKVKRTEVDAQGNGLYQAMVQAQEVLKDTNSAVTKKIFSPDGAATTGTKPKGTGGTEGEDVGGPGDAAAAYLQSESLKTKEAARELDEAIERMKAVYFFQDENQDWAKRASEMNVEQEEAVQDFTMDPGGKTWFGGTRPEGADYAQRIAATVPDEITPDYHMTDAVGLPGPNGFDYPMGGSSMNSGGGSIIDPTAGIPRFAMGTGAGPMPSPMPTGQQPPSGSPPRAPGGSRVDPEIAWMMDLPTFPRSDKFKPVPVPSSWGKRIQNQPGQPRVSRPQARPRPQPAGMLPSKGKM